MDTIQLEILTSPNCPYSPRAVKVAKKVINSHREIPIFMREVSVATHEGEKMAEVFEIDSTPTFTINGKIAFVGVPAPEVLMEILKEEMDKERYRDSYFF